MWKGVAPAEGIRKEHEKIDLRHDTMALQRLKDAAEKAKCDLSVRESAEINLPFIASDAEGPRHLNYELTRKYYLAIGYVPLEEMKELWPGNPFHIFVKYLDAGAPCAN